MDRMTLEALTFFEKEKKGREGSRSLTGSFRHLIYRFICLWTGNRYTVQGLEAATPLPPSLFFPLQDVS